MDPDSRASDTRKRDTRADTTHTNSSPNDSTAESPPTTAERDTGPGTVGALLALIQPTFLAPAVAMAIAGSVLAPSIDPSVLVLHATAVGLAVYVAHLRDALVDRFVREEESGGGTSPTALRAALVATSLVFLAAVIGLYMRVGPIAVVATGPLWLLAIVHAPYLDTGPIGVTVDYAVGVAITILGGYVLQTAALPPGIVATAAVYVLVLSAVKVSVDGLDREFDRSIGKRTIHVAVGSPMADRLAAGLLGLAGIVTITVSVIGTLPTAAALSVVGLGIAAGAVFVRPRRRSVRIQIACVYPFSAVYLGGACLGMTSVCGRTVTAVLSAVG